MTAGSEQVAEVMRITENILADLESDDARRIGLVTEPAHDPALPRPRRPSIRSLVAAAEKAGKSFSITYPDGTVLHFGVEATADDASKAWDEALTAKRRAADAKTH